MKKLVLAAAAVMLASAHISIPEYEVATGRPPRRAPDRYRDPGPVVDTTRESKRARRRRLARTSSMEGRDA